MKLGSIAQDVCPQDVGGICQVATAILGKPCPINPANCQACGAKATEAEPTAPAIGLAIGQAIREGDREAAARIESEWRSVLIPPLPDAPPAPRAEGLVYDCSFRVRTQESHTCKVCWAGKGRVVPVYFCSLLNRKCTVDSDFKEPGFDPLQCKTCDKRQTPIVDRAEWLKNRCAYLEHPKAWAGKFHGATCFLVCGGPSLAKMDLSQIPTRGPVVFAINNAAAFVPHADLWVHMDEAGRYSPTIWRDARLAKFVEIGRGREPIRDTTPEGLKMGQRADTMPNVHRIQQQGGACDPSTFFTSKSLQSGYLAERDERGKDVVARRSTMTWALRLIADLGFTTVNIIGADFHMEASQPYAWEEVKARPHDVRGCNATMAHVNGLFTELQPHLQALGITVWNCTPGGNLTAFPRRSFEDACREARLQEPPTLLGSYHWWTVRLGAITVTADRPRCFELLRGDVDRMTRKPHPWIIADSGREKLETPRGEWVRHIQLEPQVDPWESFAAGMVAGIEEAAKMGCTHVAFLEDDDRYAPNWLEDCINVLGTGVRMFGNRTVRQYNLPQRRFREFDNGARASMSQTAVHMDLAMWMVKQIKAKGPKLLDLRLWLENAKERQKLVASGKYHVAMKGLAGVALASNHGTLQREAEWGHDPDGAILAQWLGAETAGQYANWSNPK